MLGVSLLKDALLCVNLYEFNSDNAFGRAFVIQDNVTPTQTVETCIASCAASNLTVAGIEFGSGCCFLLIMQCASNLFRSRYQLNAVSAEY